MVEFVKYHNCGNDFILIKEDVFTKYEKNFSNFVKQICSRNFGIGADGLIFASYDNHYKMNYYNSDGSIAPMCGNGMLVFFKYLQDEFKVKEKSLKILTLDGEVDTYVDNKLNVVLKEIPSIKELQFDTTYYQTYTMTDHIVRFDFQKLENWHEIGYEMEKHPYFINKTNVNFGVIIDDKTIELSTFERGVGVTKACGTGALATALVAHKKFNLQNELTIVQEGGNAYVTIKDDCLILGGNPEMIAKGFYYKGGENENI